MLICIRSIPGQNKECQDLTSAGTPKRKTGLDGEERRWGQEGIGAGESEQVPGHCEHFASYWNDIKSHWNVLGKGMTL